MDELVDILSSGKVHKVVVLVGAGISVASGIPDFRSPKVGLYSSIQDTATLHNKSATFVFQLEVFLKDPKPFWWIFCKMWPKTAQALPTPFHFFIKLLDNNDLLLRCYSQNVDGLEKAAGLPSSKVINAHGVMDVCHCLDCGQEFPISFCMNQIMKNIENPNTSIEETIVPICNKCKGNHIKPDMVFFHEYLPNLFFEQYPADLEEADLLIIAGTSLEVYPFASLPKKVNANTKRFVITNRAKNLSMFRFKSERDWLIEGDCQQIAEQICFKLKWANELNCLVKNRVALGCQWIKKEDKDEEEKI